MSDYIIREGGTVIDKYQALTLFIDRLTQLDDATCFRAIETMMRGKHGRDIIKPLSSAIGLDPNLCNAAMEAWAELDAVNHE